MGCAPHEVFVASTGVIGEPLDASKFADLLTDLANSATPDGFEAAARAILTTDTYPKLATRKALIGDVEVTISGFCKGAGMIAPDMATMLCFIFTDAAIAADALQDLLEASRRNHVQLPDDRWRHVDQRHVPGVCDRRGREARPEAHLQAGSKRLKAFSAALHDLCAISPSRSPRTARA